MWIIGVDGGGTKCEAGLFTTSGELLATAVTGPANLYANFKSAVHSIDEASQQLFSLCKSQHNMSIGPQDCFISLGCAGGSINAVKQQFTQWQHQYAGALLRTDVYVSCLAANNAEACALFVIGTGSCLAVYSPHDTADAETGNASKADVKQIGGHGFLLGDIASGAWLGKQAISWYLQALETPHNDSALFLTLGKFLGNNGNNIVEQFGHAKASDFGAIVPIILSVNGSSPMVNQWLKEGATYAAHLLKVHCQKGVPIFLTGGLASVYAPMIEEILAVHVQQPKSNAIYGAYLAAKTRIDKQY